jgi:hypothetical protein
VSLTCGAGLAARGEREKGKWVVGGVGPEEREQAARGEMGYGVLDQKGGVKGLGFCLFFSKPFSNLFKL